MRLIYFLVIYYPFHEFFLKISGLSGPALFIVRQWPELVITLFFITIFSAKAVRGNLCISKVGVAPWLLMFFVWAIAISVSVAGNDLGVVFSEIVVLLRFTLLFGIIVFLNPSKYQVNRILLLLLVSVATQSTIAWVQFLGGDAVVQAFKPVDYGSIVADVERSFTSNREGAERVLIGTTGDFISLSYLIALGLFVVFLSKMASIQGKVFFVMLVILLFLSGSRTILIGSIFTVVFFSVLVRKSDDKLIYFSLLMVLVSPLFIFLHSLAQGQEYEYSNFLSIFDSRIFQSLINQRLGVAVFLIPEYILSGDFWIGFSPDRFYITDFVAKHYDGVPWILTAVLPQVLEDVYPFALFLYYGAFGIFLLLVVFIKLIWICRKVYVKVDPKIGALGLMCLISLALFSLGNQSLENRIFSFYFWLIMGLNVSLFYSRASR